jgi:hypothetical protein
MRKDEVLDLFKHAKQLRKRRRRRLKLVWEIREVPSVYEIDDASQPQRERRARSHACQDMTNFRVLGHEHYVF